MPKTTKPVVVITGAAGKIGQTLTAALRRHYYVLGLDRVQAPECEDSYTCDLTDQASTDLALRALADDHGTHIAAVIHLAAYFDFSGQDSPLYEAVNVEGTRHLLRALKTFSVERFVHASTMLVHAPTVPGHVITEGAPLEAKWAYPQSKLEAERVVAAESGDMPYTILRLAGLYDERTAVPTLSDQIARIYERALKSRFYAGNATAGQAFLHRDDMVNAFRRVVARRRQLPARNILLIGEGEAVSYEALQNRIGDLLHGQAHWRTFSVPAPLAKTAAWAEEAAEPLVPDALDEGEKPFVRPFMIDLASDHYDLDISRAQRLLDWTPTHHILDDLPEMIGNLLDDPVAWYAANGIDPPDWVKVGAEKAVNPDQLWTDHRARYRAALQANLWAHWINAALGIWLMTAPIALGYQSSALIASDVVSGAVVTLFALLSLSARLSAARWVCGAVGLWLLAAPLIFWAPTAAAYMNDTLVGALVIGFALLTRPPPGVSVAAAMTGPRTPPGWSLNPSSWFQRLPIIILAVIGFCISRYLTAYQLGHVDGVWEPFFSGGSGPKNGTEAIITSYVSEAWPVPDAGLGAMTYMLEILTGIMGSTSRWRTMPWLVMLFGFMIVPLGAVSIFFIVIQPIWLDSYCTLCLIAAVAMLAQIPFSLDELAATGSFLARRHAKGRPVLRIFFTGDSDEGDDRGEEDEFSRPPMAIIKDMLSGGVGVPWTLGLATLIGLWLMLTPLSLGAIGVAADVSHLIGALVITIAVSAFAEVGRALRYLLIPLGMALITAAVIYDMAMPSLLSSMICGAALVALSWPRGSVRGQFGSFNRFVK